MSAAVVLLNVGWHIRDKLRPVHGSVLLYVHGNHEGRSDGQPRTATSTFTQLLNSGQMSGGEVELHVVWFGLVLLYVHRGELARHVVYHKFWCYNSSCCSTVGVKIISTITFDVIMNCLAMLLAIATFLRKFLLLLFFCCFFRRDPLIFMFLFTHRVRCEMTTSKSLADTTKDRWSQKELLVLDLGHTKPRHQVLVWVNLHSAAPLVRGPPSLPFDLLSRRP